MTKRGFALAALVVLAAPAARPARAGSSGKTATRHAAPAKGPSGPVEENLNERRAVRGAPVEDGIESPELSELRRFEEEAFPRGGAEPAGTEDADAVGEPPPSLPGTWAGSGDVPEPLRSPGAYASAAPARPTAGTAPDSEWLRALKLPELPVRWDPQVLRYLNYFKNDPRGHAIMSGWLRRAGQYRQMIEDVMAREGLPKDLLYLAMVESGFDTSARSRAGAGGIWQFIPGAARAYGLEVSYWVDARRDPERAAQAAAHYLKDLYVRFGSWHLVFAAYNAGYGAVLRSITRYNTNDYWELCHHEAGLPWESSLYVPKILAAAIVGHNQEAFGFGDVVPDAPMVFEQVEVPGGTSFAEVARAIKGKTEDVGALNPSFTRDRFPPDRGPGVLRVPVGTGAQFAASFDRGRGTGDALEMVTLRFGESLDEVARAHKTTAREIRRINGVRDSAELRAGVAILVPRRKSAKGGDKSSDKGGDKIADSGSDKSAGDATKVNGDAAAGAADADSGDDEILVAVPDRVWSYEGRDRVFYRTRGGDELDEIAETLGVAPDDLVEWNNLDPTAKLHAGMVLQAFVRKDFDPTSIVLLDSARVRAVTLGSEEFLELETARRGKKRLVIQTKSGDTLAKIGRRYGLTVGDLARINRFSTSTDLRNGQKVVVYAPVGDSPREVARGMTPEPRRDRGSAKLGSVKSSSDKSSSKKVADTKGDGDSKAPSGSSRSSSKASGGSSAKSGGGKPAARPTSNTAAKTATKPPAKSSGGKSAPAGPAKKK